MSDLATRINALPARSRAILDGVPEAIRERLIGRWRVTGRDPDMWALAAVTGQSRAMLAERYGLSPDLVDSKATPLTYVTPPPPPPPPPPPASPPPQREEGRDLAIPSPSESKARHQEDREAVTSAARVMSEPEPVMDRVENEIATSSDTRAPSAVVRRQPRPEAPAPVAFDDPVDALPPDPYARRDDDPPPVSAPRAAPKKKTRKPKAKEPAPQAGQGTLF